MKRNTHNKIKLFLLVFLIVLFAGIPPILSVNDGLPYMHFWDEPLLATGALNGIIIPRITPDGAETAYGGFMRDASMLIDFFYFQYLKLVPHFEVYNIHDIKTDMDGLQHTLSHSGFYYWNRVFASAIYVLGFVFLYLLGRLRSGNTTGLIAVIILASIFIYYYSSYLVKTDIPLSTWVIGTMYFAVRFNHTKKFPDLKYSLVCVGLAMATKYTGALAFLIPASSFVLNMDLFDWKHKARQIKRLLLWSLIPLGVFVLFNPLIYVFPKAIIERVIWLGEIYKSGTGNFSKEPGWDHLTYQVGEFITNLGVPWFTLALIGLLLGFYMFVKRRDAEANNYSSDILIFTFFPVVYLLYVTMQYRVAYHRNFLMFYPILALLASETIVWFGKIFAGRSKQRNKWQQWIYLGMVLLVFYSLFPKIKGIYKLSLKIHRSSETRTQAFQFLKTTVNPDSVFLGIEKGLRVSPEDLRTAKLPYGYFNISELDIATSGFTHLIVPSYDYRPGELDTVSASLKARIDTIISERLIHSIEGNDLKYYHDQLGWEEPIVNPGVNILTGAGFPPLLMETFAVPLAQRNYLLMYGDARIIIFSGRVDEGLYNLKFNYRGTPALQVYPEINAYVNDEVIFSGVVDHQEFLHEEIRIAIPRDTHITVSLQMMNDFNDKETGEDRNIYISDLVLKKQ